MSACSHFYRYWGKTLSMYVFIVYLLVSKIDVHNIADMQVSLLYYTGKELFNISFYVFWSLKTEIVYFLLTMLLA